MTTKRRPRTHIMESESARLLASLLPSEWLCREYRPDYGLDIAIETFAPTKDDPSMYETLGEHLFVQLKSVGHLEWRTRTVRGRVNVEKMPLRATEHPEETADIEVAAFEVETPELATIDAMGAAVPVLLVLVDLGDRTAYHLCLNDYIDKVLTPEDPDWRSKKSKVVHVPRRNRIDPAAPWSLAAIAFYAKRAKHLAAFLRLAYQQHELNPPWLGINSLNENDSRAIIRMARHFHRRIATYDFWKQETIWHPLREMAAEIETMEAYFDDWGDDLDPAKIRPPRGFPAHEWATMGSGVHLQLALAELVDYWARLGNLGRMYEELCREWFMPTLLAQFMSYPAGATQ